MLTLKRVALDSKQELDRILTAENSRSADYCFGNIFMWDKRFEQSYAVLGERLILLLKRREGQCFAYPVGTGDLPAAIDEMLSISRERNIPFMICGACAEHVAELKTAYPDCFEYIPDRDYSDYLYSVQKLSGYHGKELHAKRNFCNRFEAEHTWSFEPISGRNIRDCMELTEYWDSTATGEKTSGIEFERDAISRGFSGLEELGLEGGMLCADSKPIGFSLGERISSDTFCVHYEKAHAEIAGAYAMLCREMAKMIAAKYPEIYYVNREDDMGLEALRQSKLSFKPESILRKYLCVWVKP